MHVFGAKCVTVSSVWMPLDISPDLDNEYRWAGVEDPKIIITTSRDESSRLKQFAKVWSS